LCALMIGRRAISLRGVAIAATIVLLLRPEALMGPGFQMSFAATTALVAVFGWIRDGQIPLGPRWFRPVSSVVISSAVAGLATAPIAAAHFNTIAQYGLLANLTTVPLMGVLVIPAAVLAFVLSPLGLEAIGLWIMSLGVRWILAVSDYVAHLPDARLYVAGPNGAVLPMLALGFLTLLLWRGPLRWGGIAAMAASFVIWSGSTRPDVLVSDTGTLVGVMTQEGRALSKQRGAGFIACNWLENDGNGKDQVSAYQLWPANAGFIHISGKRAMASFEGCAKGQVVVSSVRMEMRDLPCVVHDPDSLRISGTVSYKIGANGVPVMLSARAVSGDRLWTQWPEENPQPPRRQYAQQADK
ncbi:MAG: ComEC/Rec2 family competence protein, partial [Sulfitobacter sp.]